MSDLVSGRYPQQAVPWVQTGMQNNLAQSDFPTWHNLPLNTIVEDGAAIITKEETIFPVYVPWGTQFEKISIVNGATETETLTHAWASVRSGLTPASGEEFKPVLLGQSKDNTAFEGKKTETLSFTLEKALLSTPENAPRGYLYFSIFMEATKVGTYASFKCPATALTKATSGLKVYPWFTGMPLYVKSKPASATVAEKEPKEAVLVALAPVVFVQ
jgi:hypothetical protein